MTTMTDTEIKMALSAAATVLEFYKHNQPETWHPEFERRLEEARRLSKVA